MCLINKSIYRYEWLQTMECGLCRNTWFVCKTCIVKRSQMLSHHKKIHLGKNNIFCKNSVDKISSFGVSGFLLSDKASISIAKNDNTSDNNYSIA